IGDHGVILVLADRLHATDHVLYSIDDGATWMRLSLGLPDNQKMLIDTLTTEPQSTSRKFMVLGRLSGDKYAAVRLDFSGVQPRRCFFDPEDELNGKNLDDFELWSPRGMGRVGQTLDEQLCVLGHQVQYYRRIPGRACYVGRKFTKPRMLVKNCSCTRHDYECDYNYVPNNKTSKCELVPGMKGLRTECVPGKSEYFTISNGYRRIPQSTCEGGLKLDTPTTVWCPGKARTVAAFWIVFLPIAFVLCGYGGYALWRRYHNPPYGRLGVPPRGGPRAFVEHTVFGRAKATVKAATMVMSEFILDTLDRVGPYLPRPVQNLLQSGMRGLGGSHDDGALRLGSRIALEADDDDLDPLEDPRQLSANVLGVSRRAAQARYAYQPLNTRDASFGSLPTNHGLIGEDGLGEGEEDYEDDQHAVYLDEDSAATPHHTTESSQQQQQQSGTWIIDNEYANLDVVSSEEGDEVHQDNSP
ncbi:vacuolar protein sorting/targeting protein PEP1, partial [Spiromyces aspiralis]